ncbi:MAG: hypothetical protein R3F61_30700 [Myxococcota bacterium]
MRMLKAISMKRYRSAVGRSFRSAGKRFAGLGWGPFVNLGRHIRVQAKTGHRAAVVELRPGLYLVADVPAKHLKPEFGVIPLLVPLMVTAAQAAMKRKKRKPRPPQLPGPVADWADEEDVQAVVNPEDEEVWDE